MNAVFFFPITCRRATTFVVSIPQPLSFLPHTTLDAGICIAFGASLSCAFPNDGTTRHLENASNTVLRRVAHTPPFVVTSKL